MIDARRYGEALAVLEDAMVLSPGSHILESLLPGALVASGQIEKARMTCESPTTPLDDDDRHACLALVYHALGRQVDAEREMKELQTVVGPDGAYDVAGIYAQWGDKVAALQWLARAERLHNFDLLSLRVDWAIRSEVSPSSRRSSPGFISNRNSTITRREPDARDRQVRGNLSHSRG